MPLITRQGKGRKLTIQEMDGNLTYLQSRSKYKFATLPNTEYPSFIDPNPDIQGNYLQIPPLSLSINPPPMAYLDNGNIAQVYYCISVLENGILIYEAYIDASEVGPGETGGYFLAFQVDATDPTKLNKVGEVQMSQQFYDQWYQGTKKNPLNKNSVKFLSWTGDGTAEPFQTYITTLTYANGTLTAVDSITTFGGNTVEQLYEDLTGSAPVATYLQYYSPTGNMADDDYYGLPNTYEGDWLYCFDPDENPDTFYKYIGLNLLTGETRFLDTTAVFANVTNLSGALSSYNNIVANHGKGLLFELVNKEAVDDYTLNGVVAMWSPYWADPTKVTYMNIRDVNKYGWKWTSSIQPDNWYWDNNNIYTIEYLNSGPNAICIQKIELGKQDPPKVKIIPIKNSSSNVGGYAFNEFVLWENYDDNYGNGFASYQYLIWQNNSDSPVILQSNNSYPTNAFGDTIYCTSSSLNSNSISLGFQYDQYDNLDLIS